MLVNRDWTAGPQRVCRQSIDIWVCIFYKLSANKRRWETKCECGSAGQLGDVDTLSVSVGQLTLHVYGYIAHKARARRKLSSCKMFSSTN